MLNEFKRPMWNDGYSKEQPWLNYFNSYERMHCCFGDDDGGDDDSGAADDEAANTSAGGTASAAGSAAESSDSYDDAMGPGFDSTGAGDEAANTSDGGTASSAQSAAESEASYDAAMDAGPGWGEPDGFDDRDATYNAQTNNFDFAVDTKSDNFLEDVATIGFDNFENPSDLDLDLATMNEMYNNPDAYGMGYNDFVDMGYFDKAEAADYAQSKAEAAALEASYKDKGKDVSISVAKDGTYSYTGKDAGTVGLSEMGKGAGLLGQTFGVGSVMGGLDRAFGITGEKDTGISTVAGGQYYGGLREEGITSQQEKDSKGTAGPSYGGAALGGNLAELQEGYAQEAFDLGYGPSSLGYGGAALGGMTDAELQEAFAQEAFDLGIGPSSPGYGGAALGGMTDAELQAGYAQEAFDMRSAGQPDEDETFGEDETDEGEEDTVLPILPTPDPEEEKEPETAMEAYFRKLGIASPAGPVAPSSFQQYRSYLPPIGPADNAAYRRKLALGTPRYQEPSGPNPSISTLAAVYGLTYEEAAKKFAFPSVPKPPSLPVLTTFAASGGGLNSLMRYK